MTAMPVSPYLSDALDPGRSRHVVRVAYEFLRRRRREFNGLACRGVSGLAFAGPLGYRLRVPVVVVRKGESCHSAQKIEGVNRADRLVLVDDFVATGDTISEILKAIGSEVIRDDHWEIARGFREVVGIYLYSSGQPTCDASEYGDHCQWVAAHYRCSDSVHLIDRNHRRAKESVDSLLTRVPKMV